MTTVTRVSTGWLAFTLFASACVGEIGDRRSGPAPGSAPDALCAKPEPGASPLRRLSRVEYNHTVRDLLGDTTRPADAFAPDPAQDGFHNQASLLNVTPTLTLQYMKAAEEIAARASADLEALLPGCTPEVKGAAVCGAAFVDSLGRRAFRRPLEPAERTSLTALFEAGLAEGDFRAGIELVIERVLQSPQFLYRIELAIADPGSDEAVPLTGYEIATRLSYLLWGSMPDEELLAAAAAGELATAPQIAEQAARMLDDDRARDAVRAFHDEWLSLDDLGALTKDTAVYPTYTDDLRALWKEETERFVEHVVFDDPAGDVRTLLTAPYTFVDATLAGFYGVESTDAEFARVDLDPSERGGLLTQGSFLAIHAHAVQTSPVARGKFVRERLLCQNLPPPPDNVDINLPAPEPGQTTKEAFEAHFQDPACASCHRLMDPIGLGFEHFDAVGMWRDEEAGSPVDATGEILASEDADGPFDGVQQLAATLAESAEVRTCLVTKWFQFGFGRGVTEEDACALQDISAMFLASDGNIEALLVALTQTDAFRYRKRAAGEGGAP